MCYTATALSADLRPQAIMGAVLALPSTRQFKFPPFHHVRAQKTPASLEFTPKPVENRAFWDKNASISLQAGNNPPWDFYPVFRNQEEYI
jgi:hypothetical protein